MPWALGVVLCPYAWLCLQGTHQARLFPSGLMEEWGEGGARELLLHADVGGGWPASTEVPEGGRPQQGAGQACSHIPGHEGFITRMKTKLCLSFLSFCLSFLLSLSLSLNPSLSFSFMRFLQSGLQSP